MSGVQHLVVGEGEADQRLDRWFRKRFPHVTQGRIEKMLRKGEIRVEGGRAKAATRLERGQTVRVPPLPETTAAAPAVRTVSSDDAEMIRRCVLFRDDHVIAINKPAGLPVQGGSGLTRHLDAMLPALKFDLKEAPRLAHRLDKDTSGVLLLARTAAAARAIAKSFHGRTTRKIYWAAVAGRPHPQAGTITYGLVKAAGHGAGGEGEKMICLHPDEVAGTKGAKPATTDYQTLESLGTRAAWVAMQPITGRTHQLRAHMAELGCPVVGDGKYGGGGQVNDGDGWGAQLGGAISRKLHLHARRLRLPHPVIPGGVVDVTAPLSAHMERTWDQLGWRASDAPDDPFEELDE